MKLPKWLLQSSAVFSVLAMGTMILIQLRGDIDTLRTQTLSQRISGHSLTSIELIVVWGIVGAALYRFARIRSAGKNGTEFEVEATNAD